MTNERVSENPLSPARALTLLAVALGIGAALVGFWLRGGWNLGLSLAITVAEAGVWLYGCGTGFARQAGTNCFRRFTTGRRLLLAFLTLAILYLGSTYYFYANEMLHVLNFLVLLVLFVVQTILLTESSDRDWDEPLFWIEAALAPVVRPFVSLPRLGWMSRRAFSANKHATQGRAGESTPEADETKAGRPVRFLGQILLGVLLAIPVLLIVGPLLSSADAVFGRFSTSIINYWKNLSIKERLLDLALTVALFPFIFSFLESGRSRWQLLPRRTADDVGQANAVRALHREKTLKLNPITLNAFLASINILYILFAVIQVAYLTGAFRFILPEGVTHAEYARNGVFELAGITPLNVLLILLAVKGAGRTGTAGRLMRIQSLLLIAGSFVQWFSAMFRMQMYIRAYDLTLLRFFVSAFMILMAVVFVLLVIKEFRPSFAFFKAAALAALLSLVILNAVDADRRIARFNIERAVADPAGSFDLDYFKELSPDVLLEMQECSPRFDPQRQIKIRALISFTYIDVKLASEKQAWQDLNWREQRLIRGIESGCYLD
jgi:hypothetical protein